MRVVLALLVMGWVINLIFALSKGDAWSIGFAVLYLLACVYGLFLRGLAQGIVAWMAIGIGLEVLFVVEFHQHVPALMLGAALFFSAIAIFAGNMFRAE